MWGISWILWAVMLPLLLLLLVALLLLQRWLSRRNAPGWGYLLPTVFFLASVVLSIPNFKQAGAFGFSPGAFIASVLVLLFYNILTVVLLLFHALTRRQLEDDRLESNEAR